MARVLYVSYTGVLDPLGESQVLQYVLGLAKNHQMSLMTFEKPELLANTDHLSQVEAKCREAGVDWTRLTYHRKPTLPATLYDMTVGTRTAVRIARRKNVDIVHCRSYIASRMGMAVKQKAGARLIFDMRGFWADERAEAGIWSKSGLRYKRAKKLERRLFLNADHVVSLTHSGVAEYERFDYLQDRMPPSTVIPTCTNLDLFRPHDVEREGFTLGYVGSVGSWYMFDDVARAVAKIFAKRDDARFLVINKGGHDQVRQHLERAGADLNRVEIKAAPFDEVGREISRMHAGIFFIRPVWSKRASCPTRMGEFLACGKPCLANGGVGDVERDFTETGTGVVINDFDDATLDDALDRLTEITAEPGIAERCRQAAQARFSLENGIRRYSDVYDSLA